MEQFMVFAGEVFFPHLGLFSQESFFPHETKDATLWVFLVEVFHITMQHSVESFAHQETMWIFLH
jgi:hypothetical protein